MKADIQTCKNKKKKTKIYMQEQNQKTKPKSKIRKSKKKKREKLKHFCAFCECSRKTLGESNWCQHCDRQWYCSFACTKKDWDRGHSLSCDKSVDPFFRRYLQEIHKFPIVILKIIYAYASTSSRKTCHALTICVSSLKMLFYSPLEKDEKNANFLFELCKVIHKPKRWMKWTATQTDTTTTGILRCRALSAEKDKSSNFVEICEETLHDKSYLRLATTYKDSCCFLDLSPFPFLALFSNSRTKTESSTFKKTEAKAFKKTETGAQWMMNSTSPFDWKVFCSKNPFQPVEIQLISEPSERHFLILSPILMWWPPNDFPDVSSKVSSNANTKIRFLGINHEKVFLFQEGEPLVVLKKDLRSLRINIVSLAACGNSEKCFAVGVHQELASAGFVHFSWNWSPEGGVETSSFSMEFQKEEKIIMNIDKQIVFENFTYFAIVRKQYTFARHRFDTQAELRRTDCRTKKSVTVAKLPKSVTTRDTASFLLFPSYILFFVDIISGSPTQRILLFQRNRDKM